MIAAVLQTVLFAATVYTAALALPNDEVAYVDASLEPTGELLGAHFVDVDLDGREEIVLVIRTAAGSRELQLHRILANRVSPEPYHVVPILDDAIAFGFADVRPEPGRELFFLAKGGAWSLSLTRAGYRNNLARLVELDLIYDVADPATLPSWEYVFPRAGGDWILMPGEAGCVVWGPPDALAAEASYRKLAEFPRQSISAGPKTGEQRTEIRIGAGGARMDRSPASTLPGLFLSEAQGKSRVFLSSERGYRAPALIDLDGDGFLDLVTLSDTELCIHGGADELGSAPDRVESLPDYLSADGIELEFVDLDGDGDPDLIARMNEDADGFENSEHRLLLLINDGGRLFPEQPQQVLRFKAETLRVEVSDVDGDGRPDLALRKFEVPSLLSAVSGLEFTLTYILYRGQEGTRPFERKPFLKHAESYDEKTLVDALKNRVWRMDCDGDGLADLVEVDLKGRITIRRLRHSKSLFGSGTWSLEKTPWRRFETAGNIEKLELRDLNGDGLGDIVSLGDKALTVLLSTRRGGRR